MGLYQFSRMLFGITGASRSFGKVNRYLDDILIHSASLEDHLRKKGATEFVSVALQRAITVKEGQYASRFVHRKGSRRIL